MVNQKLYYHWCYLWKKFLFTSLQYTQSYINKCSSCTLTKVFKITECCTTSMCVHKSVSGVLYTFVSLINFTWLLFSLSFQGSWHSDFHKLDVFQWQNTQRSPSSEIINFVQKMVNLPVYSVIFIYCRFLVQQSLSMERISLQARWQSFLSSQLETRSCSLVYPPY